MTDLMILLKQRWEAMTPRERAQWLKEENISTKDLGYTKRELVAMSFDNLPQNLKLRMLG